MRKISDSAGKIVFWASPLIQRLKKVPLFRRLFHFAGGLVLPVDHRVWVEVQSGVAENLRMKLNPRTQTSFYTSPHDLALRDLLVEYLRPGMTFWDLGANQGIYSLVAAKLVGPTGKVLAFEPDPELVERLTEHAVANRCSNIRVIQAAVGSVDGSVSFDRGGDSGDFGQGKMVPHEESSPRSSVVAVRCMTLDALSQHEPPPNFIKCDVEGAEIEVFHSARELLRIQSPYIECEVHSDVIGETLSQFLRASGYSLKWYAESHFLAVPVSPRCP
ncbi:MAG: FkbM family methyltransferase [Candidatus Acidiferrales bacterium]